MSREFSACFSRKHGASEDGRVLRFSMPVLQAVLSIHPWAREAAELTECVALQDKSAFWKLHDFLFAHREELSQDTLQSKALDFLSHETKVSSKAVQACLSERRFEATLGQDEQLAMDLGINVTPSVFINGRSAAIRSVEDLRTALGSVMAEEKDTVACASGAKKPATCARRN